MSAPELEALEQQLRLLRFAEDPRNELLFAGDTMDSLGAVQVSLRYGAPYHFSAPISDLVRDMTDKLRLPWTLVREVVPAPQGFFYFERPVSEFRLVPVGDAKTDAPASGMMSRMVGVVGTLANDVDREPDAETLAGHTDVATGERSLPLRAFSWTIFHTDAVTLKEWDAARTGEGPLAELNERAPGEFAVHGRNGIGFLSIPQGGGSTEHAVGVIIQFYSDLGGGRIRPSGYTVWRFGRSQLDIARDEARRLGSQAGLDDPFTYGGMDNAAVATAWQFIQQNILVASRTVAPDRALRKRLERDRVELKTEPLVRVIQLRRPKTVGYVPPEDRKEVEWSCQWWVEGFWRLNHCMNPRKHKDGECVHQAVIVRGHWRGPDDAPIKAPKTVYEVVQ